MNKLKKEKLPEKRGLTVDEIISKYPMTVRILLVQLVEQIERLKKKPEVHQTTSLTIIPDEWLQEKTKEMIDIISKGEIDKAMNFIRSLVEGFQGIGKDWLPTTENINVLPNPVRNYIADMQTNADPPSMVADNIIMKDTIKTLEKMLEEKPEPLDLEQKARELFSWSADPRTIKECEDFIREIVK